MSDRLTAMLALLLLTAPVFGANVVATVDRNQVGVNESFRLSFEADDAVGEPDFSVLGENFEILDQSQNQSISITNGRTTRKYVWDLVLMATREGSFQIPPIKFGGDRSQPVNIVVKAGAEVKEADKSIFLDVEVDVEQPFVQQQVMFTVRLLRSVDIASATLSDLEVEGVDAIVERFGDDHNYQVVRNGRRWQVVERKYLVFPQQSGYLTIRPLEFRGQVVTRRSNLGLDIFNRQSGSPVVLRSESVTLGVREPPAAFVGSWLPAKRLELMESWPEDREIVVGEPVTRSITVTALGLTAAQLPEVRAGLADGLRAYPEKPTLEDSGHDDGVKGTREQSMAIIPTRPGKITLPEVEVAWWNSDEQQPEIATIPARTLDVVAAPVTASWPPAATPAGVEPEADSQPAEAGRGSSQWRGWWPWSTLALAFAWLITLVLWLADRKRLRAASDDQIRPRPIVYPGPALAEFSRACAAGDAHQASKALLRWGAAMWPEAPPSSLGRLAARCGEPLSSRINDLERHLYGRMETWKSDGMSEQLHRFRRVGETKSGHSGPSLEPMYRT